MAYQKEINPAVIHLEQVRIYILFAIFMTVLIPWSNQLLAREPVKMDSIFAHLESPRYGDFSLLSKTDYARFYQRGLYYVEHTGYRGARPVAIMLHGCAGLGDFYDRPPAIVRPDSAGNYEYQGGISTYLNTYANFFAQQGLLPFIIDSNGPRKASLVTEGDLVVSCYDTLQQEHKTYIPTRLEDVRRGIAYLADQWRVARMKGASDIYPDLGNIYLIGWSQGAETLLRFTMNAEYQDGFGVMVTMESPFARILTLPELPELRLNIIAIYPAVRHLLRRIRYLQRDQVINTGIFIGEQDEFYSDVKTFQDTLVTIPGIHHFRAFPDVAHSFDKDRKNLDSQEATNQTRADIEAFLKATLQTDTEPGTTHQPRQEQH